VTAAAASPGTSAGRGIVIPAGGRRYFTCAWVLVSLLRHHGCTLPIEIWHRGPGEIDGGMADLIAEKDVTLRDFGAVAELAGSPEALRLAAIAGSAFSSVLLLDADCAPLGDVAELFDWLGFRDTGLMVFRDGTDLDERHPAWDLLGMAPRATSGADGGVAVIDLARHRAVVEAAGRTAVALSAGASPGRRPPSALLLAALSVGAPLAFGPHAPFEVEHDLVHRGLDGEALIQHRRTSKWNLGGQDRDMPSSEATAAARTALAELGASWGGTVFSPPGRGPQALAREAELAATRHFLYQSADGTWRGLDLHPGGRIGKGRGDFEQHWAVVEREDRLVLQIYSDIRLAIELTDCGDGTWRGASCGLPGFAARLAPRDTPGLIVTAP
jgi:hypothetical protein